MKKLYSLVAIATLFTLNTQATVFTVTSLANTNTPGTLFYCISQANMSIGPHTINFSIAGTIAVNTQLPTLAQAITIDGTTAPGYSNTPVVMLDGTSMLNG